MVGLPHQERSKNECPATIPMRHSRTLSEWEISVVNGASILQTFDLRLVGTCPTCMRVSFFTMVTTWAAVLAASLYYVPAMPWLASVAGLLTLLWLAHITARTKWNYQNSTRSKPVDRSRLLALRSVAKAAVALVGMSAMMISPARADSSCGGWSGNSGCSACSGGSCYRQRTDCSCYKDRGCGNSC